jgi:WD40 repeat protein
MASIFISHSSLDGDPAARMKAWLADQGFESAFLDKDKTTGIPPGADWERTLYREIEQSQAVIIIQTPNWLASKWCFAEFTQARALGKAIFPAIEAPTGDTLISPDIQTLDLLSDRDGGLERLKRELVRIALDAQGGFDWDTHRPPFPGMLAFEEEDAAVYFGRDDDIRRLIERLEARRAQGGARLIALLGSSGSGKSSLLRAGVIPRLRRAGRNWIVIPPMRPRIHPIDELASALAAARNPPANWAKVRDELVGHDPDRALEEFGRSLRDEARANEAQILIPIDQGEELFGVADPDEARRFREILSRVLTPPFMAVLAMRSDFLGQLQSVAPLAGKFEEFSLGPMPLARVPQIIEGPARRTGLQVEDEFVQQAARDAETEDALPLLAFTLRELFDRSADKSLTLQAYKALGDEKAGLTPLENAVRKRADEVLAEAKPTEEELTALRDAFVPEMVRVNEKGQYVRRPARMDALPAKSQPLLERLARARLLVVRQEGDARVVEVAHEALLRKWPWLKQRLDAAQEFLIGKQQLEQDLRDWQNAPKEEKAGALLTGLKLGRARGWIAEHPARLTDQERAFIQASIERAETERRNQERTRRIVAWGSVGAAIILAIVTGLAMWQMVRAQDSERRAIVAQKIADDNAKQATEQRDIAEQRRRTASARQLASESVVRLTSAPDSALLFALEAFSTEDSFETRGTLMRALDATSSIASYLHAPGVGVSSTRFSPDGKLIAGTNGYSLYVWAMATRRLALPPLVAERGIQGSLFGAIFSPQGDMIAAYGVGGATLWNLVGHAIHTYPGIAFNVAFHPREHVLAVARTELLAPGIADSHIDLWDTDSTRSIGQLKNAELGKVPRIAFNRDGQLLATTGENGKIVVWKWKDRANPKVFTVDTDKIERLEFSPNDDRLVYATESGGVGVIDFEKGGIVRLPHNVHVTEIAINRAGDVLATGDEAGSIRFWSLSTYRPDPHFLQLGSATEGLAFGPGSGDLVTSAHNSPVAFLRTGEGFLAERRACEGSLEAVSIGYSESSGLAGVACADGSVSIFQLTSAPTLVRKLPATGGYGGPLSFSPDGKLLVLMNCEGKNRSECGSKLHVWSTDRWSELSPRIPAEAGKPESLAISERIIAGGTFEPDGKVYLWDATDFHRLGVLSIGAEVEKVAFTSKGSDLLVSTYQGTAADWNMSDQKPRLGPEQWNDRPVITLALSRDGTTIASGNGDKSIRLFDAQSFAPRGGPMLGHDDTIFGLAFTDEATLASASYDGSVALWDLGRREIIGRLFRRPSPQKGLVFSSKEKSLASFGADGVLTVVPIGLDTWRARACTAANRNLSDSEWTLAHPGEAYRRTCPNLPTHPSVVDAAIGVAREGDVEGATARLRTLVAQDPELRLDPAATARKAGADAAFQIAATASDIDLALASYARGRSISGGLQPNASVLNGLCWKGALYDRAAQVMEICDAAVSSAGEPEKSQIRDSRAVARALVGDLAGAADDLTAFIATPGIDPKAVALRSQFLAALRRGNNPYDAQMLEKLRAE